MTHNNKKVEEEWNAFVEHVREYGHFPDVLANYCKKFLHHQLQKARQDWLREEIERLEGMKIKESHIGIGGLYTAQVQMEVNQALQTIIDRYQSELNQNNQ